MSQSYRRDIGALLPIETPEPSIVPAVDEPTFAITTATHGWRVHITWSDGEEGPAIVFASRREAELWIERDAHDWLVRLAAIAPSSR
jgi:hypothetical protein